VSPSPLTGGVSVAIFLAGLGVGALLGVAVDRFPVGRGEADAPAAPYAHPRRRLVAPAVTALGFLLAYVQFGLSWRLLEACAFICVMVVIAFIDLERMIIPNVIVLPAALVGLAAAIALDPNRWWVYLVAAVGSSLFLFVLALIWPGGMGMGDVKLALLMGAVLGSAVVVAFFLAFLFGAVVGLVLILTKRRGRKDAIPFGPYLALGSVIALLYGSWMLDAYLGILA
jgi:prepilin signal peptidase PulO-like enzyme (type II secretory pathway)